MSVNSVIDTALRILNDKAEVDRNGIVELVNMLFNYNKIEPSVDLVDKVCRTLEHLLSITMDDVAIVRQNHDPWLESRRIGNDLYYWSRYRQYLGARGFSPLVLGSVDSDTDRIVGMFQDPEKEGAWSRRGLVVGHVQSGKTANYAGVICKAADYGYRFIVVLAGMHNNLRRQTQIRLEEAFIGLDTEETIRATGQGGDRKRVGVGRIDCSRRPAYGTTQASDFRRSGAATLGISFNNITEPLIVVVKKQRNVLENLIQWVRDNNPQLGIIRSVPLLVVDDESDNASINTKKEEDPTTINRLIRELLATFEQNCYVGYTATPFANIFIDPGTTDEMLQEDLFPRDFIACLDAPTNYVGASRIFSEFGDLRGMLSTVDDHTLVLPEKHKKGFLVEVLPESLKEAICCFVLSRAIMILRGRSDAHSSMLINVSRFTDIQKQIDGLVTDFLAELRNSIRGHSQLPVGLAMKDSRMSLLREVFERQYSQVDEDWEEIQAYLELSVGPIGVRTINSKSSDSLDYKAYKESGLHVIAVGGLSLSRGFTLEGLTVSYFLRNSIMYDTLLQMGRWFGYRDGYEDLCKLFMTADAIDWYGHISNSLDELREEFLEMERERRRPEEFGLKVRAHPESLIVTARNKMRTGQKIRHSVDVQGRLVETSTLRAGAAIRQNRTLFAEFIERLVTNEGSPEKNSQGFLWTKVTSKAVVSFLTGFKNHNEMSITTQTEPLVRYINTQRKTLLWDICLYNPEKGQSTKFFEAGGLKINQALRSVTDGPGYVKISGRSSRVASRGAERVGLTQAELEQAKLEFQKANPGKRLNISDRFYRRFRDRPLLMLHVLDISERPLDSVCAWGISFPGSKTESSGSVEYIVNTVWWRDNFEDDLDDESED